METRSSGWIFLVLTIPVTIVLAVAANGIAFLQDVGELTAEGLLGLLPVLFFGLLAVSFVYFAWTSFARASTKLRGVVWAVLSITTQLLITVVITATSFAIASFMHFVTPEYEANTPALRQNLVERLESKYQLPVSKVGQIEHVSHYRIGEEFGNDILIRVPKNQAIESLGEILLDKTPPLPDDLTMTGQRELCSGTKLDGDFGLSPELAAVLCGGSQNTRKLSWGIKQVRIDWIVLVAHFPDDGILWISEVEW
jgi:hypothetical protein